jgi:transposase
LAIELSKASWIVAVHTPLSDKISRYTLEGCDWKGLLELIGRIRKRVTRECGPSAEMISCYEASYDGFWLHRLLEGHGVRNHVIDPASLQVDRRARRAKTHRRRATAAVSDGACAWGTKSVERGACAKRCRRG